MPSSTHPPSPTHSVSDSAPISLAQNTAATDPTPQQAVQVIRDYYNAIARRDMHEPTQLGAVMVLPASNHLSNSSRVLQTSRALR